MKTVTGRVVTSHPVTLSKAASILSKFTSSEIGVSQAVSAYLRRASTAFNELKSLHKELKSSSSKAKEPRSDVTQERYPIRVGKDWGQSEEVRRVKRHEERDVGEAVHPVGNGAEILGRESGTVKEEKVSHDRRQVSQGPSQEEEGERKEGKKKKKKNKKIKEGDGIGGERKVTEEPNSSAKSVKVETEDEERKTKNEEREGGESVHLVDNGAEIVGPENGTVKEEKLSHDGRQVSQGPSQGEESEGKEGKKKKKKNKKIKEEDENGDYRKVTEEPKAGDKSVKAETEEEQRDEERKKKKKKDKKRKNDGETGSDEKRSKKKRKSE